MDYSNKSNITQEELKKSGEILKTISIYYTQRIVSQKGLQLSLLIATIANGHILLESVPGLAKTTAAKVLTDAVDGDFSRIQCTPDLLPSDIIGTQIYNSKNNEFETKLGPVYANFVLLDEINRSSAKTQSAMLEAMQERQISIGNTTYKLPSMFIVIATQNPIEQEGTYLLSEAQLDRFYLKETIEYPSPVEEVEVLNRIEKNVFVSSDPVLKLEDLSYLQGLAQRVYIDESIKKYIVDIVAATRDAKKYIPANLADYIVLGSSTRGAIAFMECAKALALINGRSYVIPEDIKALRYNVLRHRIILNFAASADNVTVENVIDAIIGAIKTP